MPACKPLNQQEIDAILENLPKRTFVRDRALIQLGVLTGFRISELLALRVSDVCLRGRIRDAVILGRSRMKGRRTARSVPLGPHAKEAVAALMELLQRQNRFSPDAPLFQGQKSDGSHALSRGHGCQIIREAASRAGLSGQVGTHSLRKTFAQNTYRALCARRGPDVCLDPLLAVSKALGHRCLQSTVSYLPQNNAVIEEAILSLEKIINFDVLNNKLAPKTEQKTFKI